VGYPAGILSRQSSVSPGRKAQEGGQEHSYDEAAIDPPPQFRFDRRIKLLEKSHDSGFFSLRGIGKAARITSKEAGYLGSWWPAFPQPGKPRIVAPETVALGADGLFGLFGYARILQLPAEFLHQFVNQLEFFDSRLWQT
jgi:hypothetical protein